MSGLSITIPLSPVDLTDDPSWTDEDRFDFRIVGPNPHGYFRLQIRYEGGRFPDRHAGYVPVVDREGLLRIRDAIDRVLAID